MDSRRCCIIMMICLLAVFACRTSETSSVLGQESSKPSIVMVYMGGFNSCGEGSPRGLSALPQWEALRREVEGSGYHVHYVLSCYDGELSTTIRWLTSAAPDTIRVSDWRNPGGAGQLFEQVETLSQKFSYPIYIVGHSYGGWLASNLSAHLTMQGMGLKGLVHGLYTIDPISPYDCNQVNYLNTVLSWSNPLKPILSANGCERAPRSYTKGDNVIYPARVVNNSDGMLLQRIREGTLEWINFYQTSDFLHSSAIEPVSGFPQNKRMTYSILSQGVWPSPHMVIHTDQVVWGAIRAAIQRRLP